MDFSRNAKDCITRKQIPDKKSIIWTVDMRCFDLTNTFWYFKIPVLLIPIFIWLDVSLACSTIVNHCK